MIEIFTAPNCNRCGKAVSLTEDVINELNNALVSYRKLSVVDEIDYAVELGVRATPAIAINGQLAFTALPNKKDLKQKVLLYL